MTAKLIDGKVIAEAVRREAAEETARAEGADRSGAHPGGRAGGRQSGLADLRHLEGQGLRRGRYGLDHAPAAGHGHPRPRSKTWCGRSTPIPTVNGILVQLPLPKGLNEEAVLNLISLNKDVDGFHPMNIGQLVMKGRTPQFIPCTPNGCIEMLERSGIPIAGADAVVVGRSNIVGVPVAALLKNADATVTICHSRTKNLPDKVRRADIVVAAIGRPEFVRGDWIKPGAAVIDVGINRIPDPTKKSGSRLVGDVNFAEAVEVAGAITPVPGGVGLMTIAMLLTNTVRAFKLQHGLA